MKKKLVMLIGALALSLAMAVSPAFTEVASAATNGETEIIPEKEQGKGKSYVITYRAGNVASFDTEKLGQFEVNEDYSIVATENYVKVTVPKGTTAKTLQDFEAVLEQVLKVDQGYMLLTNLSTTTEEVVTPDTNPEDDIDDTEYKTVTTEAKWGAATAGKNYTVTRNKDFVLDYGVLVDPVSYTVYYVDSASGEQIAPAYIGYGNVTDVITRNPIGITGYATTDTAKSITLTKDGDNSITFRYTSTYNPGTIYNGIIRYVTTVIPATATPAEGGAATPATPAAPATPATPANPAAENPTEVTPIAEEPSAADQGVSENTPQGPTVIEDESSAAGEMVVEDALGNSVMITFLVLAVALAIIGCIAVMVYRKKALAGASSSKNNEQ